MAMLNNQMVISSNYLILFDSIDYPLAMIFHGYDSHNPSH